MVARQEGEGSEILELSSSPDLDAEIANLKVVLLKKDSAECELKDTINELNSELDSYRQNSDQTPRDDIASLTSDVAAAKKTEIEQLREVNEELRAELVSHQSGLAKTKRSLEAETAESLSLDVVQLELQLSERKETISTHQQSDAEKQKEIESLSNALDSANSDLEAKKAGFEDASLKNSKLKPEEAGKDMFEAAQLSATIESLRADVMGKDARLEEYEAKVKNLERFYRCPSCGV